jgi:hypothetical protein
MIERLNKLKTLLEELKSESLSEQYGFADFIESSKQAKKEMDKLNFETFFYIRFLKEVNAVLSDKNYC